jgi:hypothetical protein
MKTPSPAPRPVPTKQPDKSASKGAAKAAQAAKPTLRFHHSVGLRVETIAVLTAIEEGPDTPRHHEAMAGIAAKLIDAGMDYYFLRPLRLAKAGFVVEQSASIASAGASRILATVTRNVLLRMNRTQLLAVVAHIRHLME